MAPTDDLFHYSASGTDRWCYWYFNWSLPFLCKWTTLHVVCGCFGCIERPRKRLKSLNVFLCGHWTVFKVLVWYINSPLLTLSHGVTNTKQLTLFYYCLINRRKLSELKGLGFADALAVGSSFCFMKANMNNCFKALIKMLISDQWKNA